MDVARGSGELNSSYSYTGRDGDAVIVAALYATIGNDRSKQLNRRLQSSLYVRPKPIDTKRCAERLAGWNVCRALRAVEIIMIG